MGQSDIDFIGLTALMVSALALVATFIQLAAQCFATVDGYRKCQPSVMGPWGKQTRLRWRWTEFRFETLFTVPKIDFNLPSQTPDGAGKMMSPFCPSAELTNWHPNPSLAPNDWNGELVGWVYILHYLHTHDISARRPIRALHHTGGNGGTYPLLPSQDLNFLRCPSISILRQSWDFVPGDVVRPVAFTSVSAMAVAARRLGLVWKQFEPYDGVFRAEGNHQVITSTVIRGIGTILQYSRDPVMDVDVTAQALLRRSSPIVLSDDLGFGRVGRGGIFGTEVLKLQIGSMADVSGSLPLLFRDPGAADPVIAVLKVGAEKADKEVFADLNDLVPLLTPFLGVSAVERPVVPWPNSSSRGFLASTTAPRAFEEGLCALIERREMRTSTSTLRRVLAAFRSLQNPPGAGSASVWDYTALSTVAADLNVLSARDTKRAWDVCNRMEGSLLDNAVVRRGGYAEMVAQHLIATFHVLNGDAAVGDVERMKRLFASLADIGAAILQFWSHEGTSDGAVVASLLDGNTDENWSAEDEDGHREVIPDENEWVSPERNREKLPPMPTQEDVEDAWCCMLLRGMCWMRLHVVVPGSVAPPLEGEFCESKLPLYIG